MSYLSQVSKKIYETDITFNLIEFGRADQFWVVEFPNRKFGITVDTSIMISPLEFHFEGGEVVIIGVHNKVAVFNSNNGQLVFLSGLIDSFFHVEEVEFGYVVITETSIMQINKHMFSVDRLISFPDVIEDYIIKGRDVTVTGVTGEIFETRL